MGRRRNRHRCPRCSKPFRSPQSVTKHLSQPNVACANIEFRPLYPSYEYNLGANAPDTDSGEEDFSAGIEEDLRFENNMNIPSPSAQDEFVDDNIIDGSLNDNFPQAFNFDNLFREYHPSSSAVFGRGTTFMDNFANDQFCNERKENVFYPFASFMDWQFGSFLLQSEMSMATTDKLLSLDIIRSLPLSFRTAKELRSRAEILPNVPKWTAQPMTTSTPTRQPVVLYARDAIECLQYILCNPALNGNIDFTPYRLYESAAKLMRLFGEWLSGDAAYEMQGKLPVGGTLLGVVLSSDKTHISNMTGGRSAHPLLISIANIRKDYRTKGNNQCFVLLALLPIAKFIHRIRRMRSLLQDRLTHEALDIVLKPLKYAATVGVMLSDPTGFQRLCYTVLASYIVDTPEAQLIACVGGKTSPLTMANYKQFGDPFRHEPRTASTTLAKLSAAKDAADPLDIIDYFRIASNMHLNGVHEPFWRNWFMAEPTAFLTTEVLHHLHRQFWDHDVRWCIRSVGDSEIDFRFSLLQIYVGHRSFNEGISKLKQVTGRIQREIQRYIIPVVSGALPTSFMVAIRALLDFRHIIQAPILDETDCDRALRALKEFHDHKDAILVAGARVGKGNKKIENWYIPKVELMQSIVPNLKLTGAPHQWSADVTERKHITEIKVPSRLGNNQKYEPQICRYLDRRDKCKRFGAALKVAGREIAKNAEDEAEADNEDHEDDPEEDDFTDLEGSSRPITNYFDVARSLKLGKLPKAPRPFRTMAVECTAIHLSRDPSLKATPIKTVADLYGLPDLIPSFADYIKRSSAASGGARSEEHLLAGRRTSGEDCLLPFESVQVWRKLWIQCKSFHNRNLVNPSQALLATHQAKNSSHGRYDFALVNVDPRCKWPDSGINGHAVVQIRLIFRPVTSDFKDNFFAYVQRFDYIHPTTSSPYSNPFVNSVTGMVALKRSQRSNGTRFGDVVPLSSLRSAVHVTPKFGDKADVRLNKETAMEYSTEFWLNTYFSKEFFFSARYTSSHQRDSHA